MAPLTPAPLWACFAALPLILVPLWIVKNSIENEMLHWTVSAAVLASIVAFACGFFFGTAAT